MELIFILTYDCNFRCTYCDIDKRKEDMCSDVIKKSLDFLSSQDISIDKVKFFGGEPLIKKNEIKFIVKNFPKIYNANFFITSNSTLIDNKFFNFSKENDIRLTFSIDGDTSTTSKNRKLTNGGNLSEMIINNTKKYGDYIRINQVITSSNSKDFFKNFRFIYDLGVRKFNFLPEYYSEWSKEGLHNLHSGFNEIKNFYNQGNTFHLVNKENYSEAAFFNLGIIIDTDGSIYGTNLILAGTFEKYKPRLKLGNIYDGVDVSIFNINEKKKYFKLVQELLEHEYPKEVLQSVKYVDKILSNFTLEL